MAAAAATHNNNFTDEKTNGTNIKEQMEIQRQLKTTPSIWSSNVVIRCDWPEVVHICLTYSVLTQLVWLANISLLTHNIPKTFQVWWKIAAMTTLPSHHLSWLALGRCFKFLRCFVSFCKWLGLLFGCVPTGGWLGGAEKFAPFAKFAPTSEIWFGPIATLHILPSIVNVVQLVSDPIVTPVMLTDSL